MGEPGGLWFIASQRVRQDWSDLAGTRAPLEKVLSDYPSPNDCWLSFPRWCLFMSHWQNCVSLTAAKAGKITYLALIASLVRQTRGRRGEGMGNGWHSNNVCYHCVCECVCLVVQSCPTLWDPMDWSPPSSSVHGDSPGKNTGVGSLSLLQVYIYIPPELQGHVIYFIK